MYLEENSIWRLTAYKKQFCDVSPPMHFLTISTISSKPIVLLFSVMTDSLTNCVFAASFFTAEEVTTLTWVSVKRSSLIQG